MRTAEHIADFATGLAYADLPPHVVADARLRFMDTLGVCLMSSRLDFSAPVAGLVREQGGRQEATVLGFGDRAPASQVGLVNGTLAHGAEFDDTDAGSGIHPSAFVVTSALAVAERQRLNGRDMLVGAVAGYELALRMGRAGVNHKSRFHPTAISGTFAATLVAGKLIDLDRDHLASALGIAGSQAAGSWKFLEDGSGIKRLHGGWPVHCGITAALLAQRGLTGPHGIFDGARGALDAYGSLGTDSTPLVDGLGSRWLTPATTFKAYPCCSLAQAAMDAVRVLQRQHGLAVDDVEQVECAVSPEAFAIVCEPRSAKLHPLTAFQAAFSLPFCVAVALLDDTVSAASFAEARLSDRQVARLAERVAGVVDPELNVADGQPARVVMRLCDGRALERSATLPGTPTNPFTAADVEAKFHANARGVIGPARATAAVELLRHLEDVDDLAQLTALLVAEPARG